MLMKITDLEENLLEVQLQIERMTDEQLTHMLLVQNSPTDKTRLGYVTSTSKTIFVKPTIPEPPHAYMDKGKVVIGGDVPTVAEPTQIPPTKREPPRCHHYGLSGHIRPMCRLLHA
jgi:hypothetical protein